MSVLNHAGAIRVLAPQGLAFDASGRIRGTIDSRIVTAARKAHARVIPLLINQRFDPAIGRQLLREVGTRRRAIRRMAQLCRDERYDGIQLDLEHLRAEERDALSEFVREASAALHRVGCAASIAVIPRLADQFGSQPSALANYEEWTGVYDYRELARVVDFLTLMTYAEHTRHTEPGPVASLPWMETALQYVLKSGVPASKVSLGIAVYSAFWAPDPVGGGTLSHAAARRALSFSGAEPTWDSLAGETMVRWQVRRAAYNLALTDARSFAERLKLVVRYRLRGYSVWAVGLEDPEIWRLLPKPASSRP